MARLVGPNEQAGILRAMGLDPTNAVSWQIEGGYDRIVEATIEYRVPSVDESHFKKYRLVEVQEEDVEQPVDGERGE